MSEIASEQADRLLIEVQRMWIAAAAAAVAREGFIDAITVRGLCWRAAIPETRFPLLFDDLDDCLAHAFGVATSMAANRVAPSWSVAKPWPDRVADGLLALLGFFDDEPALASLCLLEPRPEHEQLARQRDSILDELAGVIAEGQGAEGALEPKEDVAIRVVHRALELARRRFSTATGHADAALAEDIFGAVFAPYFGDRAVPLSVRARLSLWDARVRSGKHPKHMSLEIRLAGPALTVLAQLAPQSGQAAQHGPSARRPPGRYLGGRACERPQS